MSESTPDPFGPVDPSAFNAAKDAWYADRDRIVSEVIPHVDRAITAINDWTGVVNDVTALIGAIIPMLKAVSGVESPPVVSGNVANLTSLVDKLVSVKTEIDKLRSLLPGRIA